MIKAELIGAVDINELDVWGAESSLYKTGADNHGEAVWRILNLGDWVPMVQPFTSYVF